MGDEEALNDAVCWEYYRVMPIGNRARFTVNSKTILKRASIVIPTSEYMKDHMSELRGKI